MISQPKSTTISSTDWTKVSLGSSYAHGFTMYVVNSMYDFVPFYINTTDSGTGVPVPAVSINYGYVEGLTNTICYAKTTTDSGTLVILPGNYNKA